MNETWRPEELGLRIRPDFGTERLIMLEELGGVYYVVAYKPRRADAPDSRKRDEGFISYSERVGQGSEFCREGYAVVSEEKIERAEVELMFRLLATRKQPGQHKAGFGLDGVTYELFWKADADCTSYEWWLNPPKDWQSLGAVADMLRDHVFTWGYD